MAASPGNIIRGASFSRGGWIRIKPYMGEIGECTHNMRACDANATLAASGASVRCGDRDVLPPSWPGMSRPSAHRRQRTDARDMPGHDGKADGKAIALRCQA